MKTTRWHLRQTSAAILAGLATASVLGALTAPAHATPTAPTAHVAAKPKNADFTGHWLIAGGQGFVVTSENPKTGKCRGTTDLGGSYGFTGCRVTGHHYTFVITYGASYRSVNRGTFTGNHLVGGFDDGGTKSSYSGTRHRPHAA